MNASRLLGVLFLVVAATGGAQTIDTLEFRDARIADILVTLGSATGRSIVPDETVTGRASYYFEAINFREALDAFAARFNLYIEESDGIVSVSAIRVRTTEDGSLTVEAPLVRIDLLLRRLSRASRVPVLFERLPAAEITYFAEKLSLPQILQQIATQLPDHELAERAGAYVLAFTDPARPGPARRSGWITEEEGLFSVHAERAGLSDLVRELFETADREYQLLKRANPQVENLYFSEKEFNELLKLILEQADASFAETDGIYYITDAPPQAAAARSVVTERLSLEFAAAATILDLLPPEQSAGVTIRQDRAAGALSLTGNAGRVAAVTEIIRRLDLPPQGREYPRMSVASIPAATLPSLLPVHLQSVPITPLPDGSSFIALVSPEQRDELERYVEGVDTSTQSVLVELQYIQLSQLLAHLPASALPGDIVATGDPTRFFYAGPPGRRDRFLEELEQIDRPVPQIRYQLLVIQYQESNSQDFDLDISNSLTTPDSTQAFLGTIGNLLSLNFDIVSSFGYAFASRLNWQLGNATAAVLADTTLSGLSGQSVSFQNTNTFRYRDVIIDPDSGDPEPTGVIREITSGLVLEIEGWASSGGTVTMTVAATISKRGTDGGAEGNPPPTSEKVVRTHVRAQAGEPVILSGLLQQEEDTSTQRTPLLSDIPGAGVLFEGRRSTRDTTELAIYIVPQVDRGPDEAVGLEELLLEIYRENFGR
jgi:type II secretory pathway component GspD/PulD (secretin)